MTNDLHPIDLAAALASLEWHNMTAYEKQAGYPRIAMQYKLADGSGYRAAFWVNASSLVVGSVTYKTYAEAEAAAIKKIGEMKQWTS